MQKYQIYALLIEIKIKWLSSSVLLLLLDLFVGYKYNSGISDHIISKH